MYISGISCLCLTLTLGLFVACGEKFKSSHDQKKFVWFQAKMRKSTTKSSQISSFEELHEEYLKRLNSKNITTQQNAIMSDDLENQYYNNSGMGTAQQKRGAVGGLRIIIGPGGAKIVSGEETDEEREIRRQMERDEDDAEEEMWKRMGLRRRSGTTNSKKRGSENFEVIDTSDHTFSSVGGYDAVKLELQQCVDILRNVTKYEKFNVRIPRGLVFEGPPGNGKTLMAKALAGEANIPFITVSGSQFQEKYVGVGASRIRELFDLARECAPVVVFIDEIDALGRRRGGDNEGSNAERDNTLNELLVAMDGFKNTTGVFVVGATNRADLLDPALMRPGRIDKRVFIGNPDPDTRKAILNIHSKGKPMDIRIRTDDLVEMTTGLSGAQLENLLNEAMLGAIRENREIMTQQDIDVVMNRMMVGWQPTEHKFTSDIIDHIAIHEMGHHGGRAYGEESCQRAEGEYQSERSQEPWIHCV